VSHQRDKDIRSAPYVPIAAAERGDLEVDRAAVAFNHRFNRLAFQLRAAIRDFDFAPVPSLGGGPISNDDRDELERGRLWRFSQDRDCRQALSHAARRRYLGLLGRRAVSRRRLVCPAAPYRPRRGQPGLGRQRPNVAQLPDLDGVLIDANLAWRASALTIFLFTAQSTFIDSIAVGSSGGLARQLGFEVRHVFWRRLIGSAGVRVRY